MKPGGLEELVARPRALRVLLALARGGPLNMRQFIEASGHARPHAQALREDLVRLGYIAVEQGPGHGNAGVLRISLTPWGRDVAALVAQLDERLSSRGPPAGASSGVGAPRDADLRPPHS